MERAYDFLFFAVLLLIACGLVLALIRAIKGPRTADRILGVNLAGSMTILAIALLAYVLKIEALIDVCLIYCLASFLSVVVLSKIYVTAHLERTKKQSSDEEGGSKNV